MRILVVSAHYPPNFVSGGTLQPQRIARALRDRGHDVFVYAGWLGDRPALETWEEVDETGLPVRWIVTGPFIGWSDRRNWDNRDVAADLLAYARKLAPDVVHLHSLQSVGATALPDLARNGARVVVTMHDFWWLCIRQFLVDLDGRPCCPVLAAGVCACETGHAAAIERAAWLRGQLAAADAVLAPSESTRRLLAANGVAPGRLDVDENGLPAAPRRADARRARDGTVRFLYTGGSHHLKGVGVLLDAARMLDKSQGWSLSMHGAAAYVDEHDVDITALPVAVEPPYPAEAATEVMHAHDVMVVPSVMRESHSIVTREALIAGLPVISSDCVGPEEVVDDERNGFVVPTGDAAALASAMRRLVDDPALLDRLASAAPRMELRSVGDQAEALEVRFEALLRTPRRVDRDAHPGHLQRVVFICGIEGAPLRYRARLPAEALALAGVDTDVLHYRDPAVPSAALAADVVVAYRVPATPQILGVLEQCGDAGIPRCFDVDDLIFDPDVASEIPALRLLPPDEADLWLEGVRRYRTTMEACDLFVASTPMLATHATAVTGLPSARFDNGVGILLAQAADRALHAPRSAGPVRLGYFSGTTTHDEDWYWVEPAVVDVLDRHADVEIWLGGHLPATPALDRFGGRVRRLPFVAWDELPAVLRDVDVNLAPLAPGSRFNEAKSAIKWLEAALTETATVATPTGPFADAIVHERTGMLARDLPEWIAALDALIADPSRRAGIGAKARREALLRWSPHLQSERYLAVLAQGQEAATSPRTRRPWTPVTRDEPFTPSPLEPYGSEMAPPAAQTRPMWRRVASKVRMTGRRLTGK